MTFEAVTALAMTFPGVEAGTSYGTPALKVRGKFLLRLKEDGKSIVLHTPFVVRDYLMQTHPEAFYITDHYKGYPAVLVRLRAVKKSVLTQLLEDAWRSAAPKRLVKEYDDANE